MNPGDIIKFAVIGHPNEGKSSIVSTLAEDDSVRVSPTPGETIICQTFPVKIDGVDRIHFIDTPGFQRPRQALAWIQSQRLTGIDMVKTFIKAHRSETEFQNECQLFSPVADGAGIIYVVDTSKPIRKHDKMEMEILRLTGRPRMALVNSKSQASTYFDDWKNALSMHFNTFRVFNAHRATYSERIDLLKCLKQIAPDWQEAVSLIINAFQSDWQKRNRETALLICQLLEQCATHQVTGTYADASQTEATYEKLFIKYQKALQKIEKDIYHKIRRCFKQNIFNLALPQQSILRQDLFHQETWKVLGLTKMQLAATAAAGGSLAGASLDIAAAGITFGIFTGIGGVLGAGAALLWGKKIAKVKIIGSRLSGYEMIVGPSKSPQFPFILLDRALIYYASIINWAHGRRDYEITLEQTQTESTLNKGRVAQWPNAHKQILKAFIDALPKEKPVSTEIMRKQLIPILLQELQGISSE